MRHGSAAAHRHAIPNIRGVVGIVVDFGDDRCYPCVVVPSRPSTATSLQLNVLDLFRQVGVEIDIVVFRQANIKVKLFHYLKFNI